MTTKKITKIISTENGDNYVADIEDIENRITQNSSNLETAKQELSNKCNEALSQAKAYTDQEKAKYLPLTGTADNASNLGGYPSTNYVRSINNISPDENGNVKVTTSEVDLSGIVKSVNNVQPDSNGNVIIEAGKVKTVEGIEPDEKGNIQLGFEFSTEDDINGIF